MSARRCQKGRRIGYKCYLVYNSYEDYAGASRKCLERGGRMAMPRDRKEQEALADYVKAFFHPGNWPVWLGINDLQSEGTYLYDDGAQVSYFQWRKHFLSSQPDGGRRGELRRHGVGRRRLVGPLLRPRHELRVRVRRQSGALKTGKPL
ncbi:unnamed protein product [Tetraodon nigroviridis]|uniref:Chromosome 14 SCAF15120, whole genome shotgun sequence n=1 Tax=Tetraodon nigroviridis TaxID=99883 RepID=Q4RF63_TETNG|nr:unnamed protein product [Tetraodon nigroviridis]